MGYTPEWWEKNGEDVKARRNARYAKDPEFREKARERARAYRAKKKAEREAQKGPPTIEINGKQKPALTTEQVCEKHGIEKSRIKYMQRAGYLPSALVTRPVRLYSETQSDLIGQLETCLREHQDVLRGPASPESEKAQQAIAALTTTIHEKWET